MTSSPSTKLSSSCLLLSLLVASATANVVTVDKTCYSTGQIVRIDFENEAPLRDDWFGVYSADADINALPSPASWIWTCGSRNCKLSAGVQIGAVFYPDVLPTGSWKVVLARNEADGAPFVGVAASQAFEVSPSCGVPVAQATPSPFMQANPAPIFRATPSPVVAPVQNPASNSAVTDKSTYAVGEQITVTFSYETPKAGDWIGVYPASANSNMLSQSALWSWTCGSTNCQGSTGSGTAIMKNGNGWQGGEWPLAAGSSWIAYVVRADVTNVNGGVVTAASSPVFTIGGDASGGGDSSGGSTLDTEAALLAARADIRNLIRGQGGDVALAAKFLRLGFHDCIGGCDGCVDLSNMENGGLLVPIQALRPVVEKYANADTGLSRADIWALATATGAAVMQGPVKVSFDLTNVGRVDCENANTVCQNEHGEVQDCSDIRGPHRVVPGMNTNSRELFEFFFNEFGFDTKEGVALMGAHTIGQLKKENTGVEGHGWMRNNDILDNEYYHELIGGSKRTDPFDTFINNAPNWQQTVETNNPNGIPDRHVWTGNPGGVKIVMLNADIAMVRDLNSTNMDENGKVSCNFRRQGACPVNERVITFLIDYTFDNRMWLNDFSDVLLRMLRNKYTETTNCIGSICLLQPN